MALADVLLPPVCISCRKRAGAHGLQDRLHRSSALPVYDRARAAARYSSTMRDLIQSFKYGDRHEGVPLVFWRWMAAAGAELLADPEVIVPVPLYRSRLWSRRFNQSAMLAQAVGGLTGVPVDCFLLARVKRTHSQVGLTAAQRRKNVAGAFRLTAPRGHYAASASLWWTT
jgi:predicted amidophosphoribosyltransferase